MKKENNLFGICKKNINWIEMVTQYGHYVSENGFLSCKGEQINMKD
ncbi:MAG: hypothetical protein RIS64_1261 [Bacteroidota bacterium]|jgi:hypothetical protein